MPRLAHAKPLGMRGRKLRQTIAARPRRASPEGFAGMPAMRREPHAHERAASRASRRPLRLNVLPLLCSDAWRPLRCRRRIGREGRIDTEAACGSNGHDRDKQQVAAGIDASVMGAGALMADGGRCPAVTTFHGTSPTENERADTPGCTNPNNPGDHCAH